MPVADEAGGGRTDPVIGRAQKQAKQPGLNYIDRLVGPECLQEMVSRLCIFRIELADPFPESLCHLCRRPMAQNPLGVMASPVFRVLQMIEQPFLCGADKLRLLNQGAPLSRQAPDPAVLVVSHGAAKINLTMLDNGVVPVSEINRSIRPHLYIDRPESDVL